MFKIKTLVFLFVSASCIQASEWQPGEPETNAEKNAREHRIIKSNQCKRACESIGHKVKYLQFGGSDYSALEHCYCG